MTTEELHDTHREALPWLANGTLAGPELERVQAHVHGCAACRAELAQLHTLRAAEPPLMPGMDMDGAFARLLPQLDAPAPVEVQQGWRFRLAANDHRWLRVAVGAQFCAIAVMAALLLRPAAPSADYRVLGAAPGAETRLIVTFKPDTPERELRRIVLASGARIVGGPTATGAWMLGTEGEAAAVANHLRAEPAVTLAEPFGGSQP